MNILLEHELDYAISFLLVFPFSPFLLVFIFTNFCLYWFSHLLALLLLVFPFLYFDSIMDFAVQSSAIQWVNWVLLSVSAWESIHAYTYTLQERKWSSMKGFGSWVHRLQRQKKSGNYLCKICNLAIKLSPPDTSSLRIWRVQPIVLHNPSKGRIFTYLAH